MITAILQFFGRILLWIYNFCGNYALALAIFTLLSKIVVFPLSYKGKQSMMRMNALNEEQQRLQKQYGKDQQRYQEELSKLYEQQGVNPMSGCLWSMLPLPILMGLYYVIRRPMLYMLCLTEEQITAVVEAVAAHGLIFDTSAQAYQEISIMSAMNKDPAIYETVAGALGDAASKLQNINFNFFGIDLGAIPNWKFWTWESFNWAHIGLFLIPIVVTVLNFLYSQYSLKSSKIQTADADEGKKKNKDDNNSSANNNSAVMMVMPLMYLWFGYIMPAGMCIYMACSAVFSMLQELLFSKVLNKRFAAEAEQQKAKIAAEREKEKEKKAEIAARRAAEEEEMKKKGGKKAYKQAQKKNRDSDSGQVGVRRYARGRAYEADRYPITPYRDPQDVLDEEALERALAKRGKKVSSEDEEPNEIPETAEIEETTENTEATESAETTENMGQE